MDGIFCVSSLSHTSFSLTLVRIAKPKVSKVKYTNRMKKKKQSTNLNIQIDAAKVCVSFSQRNVRIHLHRFVRDTDVERCHFDI